MSLLSMGGRWRRPPSAVDGLPPLQITRERVGCGVGRVLSRRQAGQDVADGIDAARNRDVLQHAFAPAFEVDAAGRLLRSAASSTRNPFARGCGGHQEQAVVVTRDAAGGPEKDGVGVLQQRQADGALPRFAGGGRASVNAGIGLPEPAFRRAATPPCRRGATRDRGPLVANAAIEQSGDSFERLPSEAAADPRTARSAPHRDRAAFAWRSSRRTRRP